MNFCTWTAIEGVSGFGAGAGAGLLVVPELADVAPHGRVADDDVAGQPRPLAQRRRLSGRHRLRQRRRVLPPQNRVRPHHTLLFFSFLFFCVFRFFFFLCVIELGLAFGCPRVEMVDFFYSKMKFRLAFGCPYFCVVMVSCRFLLRKLLKIEWAR